MAQNDPHNAKIIVSYVSFGKWGNLKRQLKKIPDHFAVQVMSHQFSTCPAEVTM